MPTFSELLNDIRSTTEVSSSDFDTQLPRIVNRAETRLIKELDDFGLNTLTSIVVSINNPVVSLPSGTRIVRNLNVLVSASVSAPAVRLMLKLICCLEHKNLYLIFGPTFQLQ